jgi:hypothetical protein
MSVVRLVSTRADAASPSPAGYSIGDVLDTIIKGDCVAALEAFPKTRST